MEILSQNINNKKAYKGVKSYKKVCEGGQRQYIGNKSYITVNALGKTWRVKEEAKSKWLKIAKIEDLIRNNLSEVLGAISIGITGILIYFLMFIYY